MQETEHEYRYQLKPIIIPGTLFLILYPVIMLLLVLVFHITPLERTILTGVYIVTGLGIVCLWIYGRSKIVRIEEESICFTSLSGEQHLGTEDIRRVVLFTLPKGQEMVQITTAQKKIYYLSELYFPFPELMSDLEQFVKNNALRSNL